LGKYGMDLVCPFLEFYSQQDGIKWWWAISNDLPLRSRAHLHGTRSISVDPRVALVPRPQFIEFLHFFF
jgi:hypothetical protein